VGVTGFGKLLPHNSAKVVKVVESLEKGIHGPELVLELSCSYVSL
jgi:hypothetical protein